KDFHRMLENLTGQHIFSAPIPGPVFRAMGITTDAIRKIVDFKTDITREAMEYITRWPPADTSRIENATGLQFRSGEETFSDAIAWLAAAGHLDEKRAGRLAHRKYATQGE